ncbi:MAG: helix-turn-helix transcriptional regulator [Actinomycetota bacterium]|nr:helix-turn-helix transcriptional regulator [Actinomycetota bacterium]
MNEKKSSSRPPRRVAEARYRGMTPNQVVAYNLMRARQLRGWTQEQAAAALEPYLGLRWSKASFSQAERSVAGRFVRQFDADEVVAFARGFELPITWFYMPPPPWKDDAPVKLTTPDARRFGTELALLVDLVFGDDSHHRQLLEERLREFLDQLGPDRLTQAQERIGATAALRTAGVVRHRLGDIEQWEEWLRIVADRLEELRGQVETSPGHAGEAREGDSSSAQPAARKSRAGEPPTSEDG